MADLHQTSDALPRAWALDYGGTEWHQSRLRVPWRSEPAGAARPVIIAIAIDGRKLG
jgi:hypothetical protein